MVVVGSGLLFAVGCFCCCLKSCHKKMRNVLYEIVIWFGKEVFVIELLIRNKYKKKIKELVFVGKHDHCTSVSVKTVNMVFSRL